MKKLILVMVMLLLMSSLAWAQGTVTQTRAKVSPHEWYITMTWISNATGTATVPSTATTWPINGWVTMVVTNPGVSNAPDDNYDIVLNDSDSVDVMGGNLANRDTANTEQAIPTVGTGLGSRYVSGALTLAVTGITTTAARGTVVIYIYTEEVISSF